MFHTGLRHVASLIYVLEPTEKAVGTEIPPEGDALEKKSSDTDGVFVRTESCRHELHARVEYGSPDKLTQGNR